MAIPTFTGRQLRGYVPTILTYAVLAVVVYLMYRLIKKGFTNLSQGIGDFLNTDVQQQLQVSEAQDGTVLTEQEVQDFKSTAKQIADAQENALYSTGFFGISDPDEEALFMPLLDYNGAQLREIYREYGQRRGKTLFEAYQNKLRGGMLESFAYYDDRVQGCENYFDDCSEVEFARGIWMKSGLPISF